MYRAWSSRRRLVFWTWAAGSAALAATLTMPSEAQTVVTRDSSGRVYRIQLRQLTDSTYMGALRRARVQLKRRIDSLSRELDDISVESPDRVPRIREINALVSSLANLSDLEDAARVRAERSARAFGQRQPVIVGGGEGLGGSFQLSDATLPRGWIGINVEAPHQRMVRNDTAFIRYFSYPEIVSVEPNSPAERVGISRGDRLVAYDGADVRDREINLTRLLQPSRRITVTVRRDGEDREFAIVVGRAPSRLIERRLLSVPDMPGAAPVAPPSPALWGVPGVIVAGPNGGARVRAPAPGRIVVGDGSSAAIAGASLSEIRDEGLGQIFGVASGLLITEVFSDPAQSSGLRGGDVIVGADGQDIKRLAQLRRIIGAHGDDRTVELEVVRQKRTRMITLRW
jgi:hypothetical protein